MKTLCTGSSGMIGSNVAKLLENRGEEVRYADLRNGIDLRESSTAEAVCEDIGRVFHLADYTAGIGFSSEHHGMMLTGSTLLSLTMLEAARKAGVKEYLLASSSCVYPSSEGHKKESELWYLTPETANEGYGFAKRIAEQQAIYYARDYGMRIVIARPANVYGPSYNWNNPHPHVIPSLILQMLSGQERIVIWGSGHQTRSFMHERDAARILVGLMERGESGQAYNLGGFEVPIHELAMALSRITGYKGHVEFDTERLEGPLRKAYDTVKLEALGLWPSTSIWNGLEETVEAARKALKGDR